MKKIIICVMAAFLSFTFIPLQANAAKTKPASSLVAPDPAKTAEANALVLRLNEINAMDKSNMKASEKRELRKEVKSLNHKLREASGGIYLSAGLIILIVILLVVLL